LQNPLREPKARVAKFDWAARVNRGQAIAPLGDSIFGDQTSYYDGSTTFSVTDVDLPGNSALPVRISRMHRASDPQGFPTTGFLGEWDLELPHVRGTYSRTAGWVVDTASWGSSKDAKAHRGQQKELIDAGKFKEAQDMDISDVQSKFGDKYDVQIQEMKEYTDRQQGY
jgi:hypothetical protein